MTAGTAPDAAPAEGPSAATLALAATARTVGIAAPLDGPGREGMADPGVLWAGGPDAARFLHAGLTNDVEGLSPGQGNLTARVTRKGKLVGIASLHRLPPRDGHDELVLLGERSQIPGLLADLDAFLFADRVTLEDHSDRWRWVTLQGPAARAALVAAIGEDLGGDATEDLAEHSIRPIAPAGWPPGCWLVVRSLGGDDGALVAFPVRHEATPAAVDDLLAAAARTGLTVTDGGAFSAALEVLRIEAGVARVGPDTPGRERLLPETGMEQTLVSYTKGCFLGQEVIARVRTYGKMRFGLRALVVRGPGATDPASLARLPASGEPLITADGRTLGQLTSRTWSPLVEAPVVLAYVDRAERTPGTRLELAARDGGTLEVDVALLPLHRAADGASRAAALYDRAIRVFAEGDEARSLALLEEALRADPAFADAYEAVGLLLGRSGRFHEAIDVFTRLEEVAPDEPLVHTNLSLYFMKVGDKARAEEEAAKAMSKSVARASGGQLDVAAVAREQEASRRKDALRKREMFAQVLEIDDEDPVALYGMGNALSVLGEWDEAEGCYARGIAAQADNSAMYLGRGKALEKLERPGEALAAYREGMKVASARGDLMPLREMENRALLLAAVVDDDEAPA